jgi:hypothetical protein
MKHRRSFLVIAGLLLLPAIGHPDARTTTSPAPAPLLKAVGSGPVAGHACDGSSDCRVCKNCKYCGYCAKGGGTCGVCR